MNNSAKKELYELLIKQVEYAPIPPAKTIDFDSHMPPLWKLIVYLHCFLFLAYHLRASITTDAYWGKVILPMPTIIMGIVCMKATIRLVYEKLIKTKKVTWTKLAQWIRATWNTLTHWIIPTFKKILEWIK